MPVKLSELKDAASRAVIKASTGFEPEKFKAWERALDAETEANSRWLLEMMLENARVAAEKQLPLCDDTGIPYAIVEVGEDCQIDGNVSSVITAVEEGIAAGLRRLPGRPMAVKGNDFERIAQSCGLHGDSGRLLPSPVRFSSVTGKTLRITVLLQGGGPEIRAKTYRVFHHHDMGVVQNEVAHWAVEMAKLLGCTPSVPAIGIGRTHYEANCLMMDAMAFGTFGQENEFEKNITRKVNESGTGPLGIGGNITAIQTFSKIGEQRASGVRIVSLRMGCMVDPRRHTIELS